MSGLFFQEVMNLPLVALQSLFAILRPLVVWYQHLLKCDSNTPLLRSPVTLGVPALYGPAKDEDCGCMSCKRRYRKLLRMPSIQ